MGVDSAVFLSSKKSYVLSQYALAVTVRSAGATHMPRFWRTKIVTFSTRFVVVNQFTHAIALQVRGLSAQTQQRTRVIINAKSSNNNFHWVFAPQTNIHNLDNIKKLLCFRFVHEKGWQVCMYLH